MQYLHHITSLNLVVVMRWFGALLTVSLWVPITSLLRPVTVSVRRTRNWDDCLALSKPASGNEPVDGRPPQTFVYQLLSTPRDQKPGQCNFFYNDEVMSHLHGYMLLVGLFAAADQTFLLAFATFASLAAGFTLAGYLPANPRVPALVALLTLFVTCICRFVIRHEAMFFASELNYQGPTENALLFEILVCAINVAWGLQGSWRTKEMIHGATFGF